MAKRGRPRLPIQEHVIRGTYRADRHGPLPALRSVPAPAVGSATPPEAGRPRGAHFTANVLKTWSTDDVVGQELAAAAGEALDRRAALDALLDGPEGVLARVAAGTIPASHLTALLGARKQALEQFADALGRLELDDAPAGAMRVVR